jgi:ferritin-like metal-binding protein YciE
MMRPPRDLEIFTELDDLLAAEVEFRTALLRLVDLGSSEDIRVAFEAHCAEAVRRIAGIQASLKQRCPPPAAVDVDDSYDIADDEPYWEDLRRR